MVKSCQGAVISPSTIVDVGAGVGIFSIAASVAWPDASVIAVDVNPVTLG
ncbi:MAG: 50S ribosomal protein L11 methyltransferase, partial [Propionibacteriaceae bacterium]|nr:50S ribosomal protein L11 methyltransferase [Propionibacteriaceae bacterium]